MTLIFICVREDIIDRYPSDEDIIELNNDSAGSSKANNQIKNQNLRPLILPSFLSQSLLPLLLMLTSHLDLPQPSSRICPIFLPTTLAQPDWPF